MEVGIIGLSQSGKTTIFNALSKGSSSTNLSPALANKINFGVAKVPDIRMKPLQEMFKPQKTTYAEVRYTDLPTSSDRTSRDQGITGESLNLLQRTDAIVNVVRAFDNPVVPHIEGSIDPKRDLQNMTMDLVLSDLLIIERRLTKLSGELKNTKAADKDNKSREYSTLQRIQEQLELEIPIRDQEIATDEAKLFENYQFLTSKPMLIIFNIPDTDSDQADSLEKELKLTYAKVKIDVVTMCGSLEMELSEIEDEEAEEFRNNMHLQEPGLYRAIRSSYQLLGLTSFFTVGPDEVKAWTIDKNLAASKAAGKIHSDIERGFIRAEVISYDHLMECGGIPEAKKKGLLRLEGKTYPVQDGDVINFLFNV